MGKDITNADGDQVVTRNTFQTKDMTAPNVWKKELESRSTTYCN